MRRGLTFIFLLILACGGRGPSADMRRAFEKGDFKEVVTLGRHAVRGGDTKPEVHYYYGLALVAIGRDPEGFAELDTAITRAADLKPKAAAALREMAATDGVSRADAARRLRKAHELDPAFDLGHQRFEVAGAYYDDRDFKNAAAMYEEAVAKFPDARECETAYARLSECWAVLGEPEKARAAMETLVKRYPRGQQAQGAASNLNDIMFREAQKHLDAGEFDQAIALARELVQKSDNRSLQQKGRFLLGQAYEGKGDRAAAYDAYREVIRNDRGDSGQTAERARARIEALQEAGLK